jgi:hypothetical protein
LTNKLEISTLKLVPESRGGENMEEEMRRLKRKVVKLEEQLIEIKENLIKILEKLKEQESEFFEIEEINSSYTYPPGREIASVQTQLTYLRKYFPSLQLKEKIPATLPEYAEGWLVVPKFSKIASDYNDALETALRILQKARPNFLNGRDGELGKEYLRLNDRTLKAIEILSETTKGDYLLLPIQLGCRYVGKSPRRVRALLQPNEFCLGPFEIAIFLLTHQKWLTTEDDLGIDCTGGEYGPYKHARFKNILCFYFLNNKLHLNDRWSGCPDKKFGTATAFLPKNLKLK